MRNYFCRRMKFKIKSKSARKGLTCLDCGAPLQGNENFCSYCGQKNDTRHLSFKRYFADFFDNFFSFDSKLYRSIYALVFKPAFVAKAYIEGKRTRYANPFRLLLHISIVYFLLNGFFSMLSSEDNEKDDKTAKTEKTSKKTSRKDIYFHRLDSIFESDHLKTFFNNDSISQQKKDSVYKTLLIRVFSRKYKLSSKKYLEKNDYRLMRGLPIVERYFSAKGFEYDGTAGKQLRENFNQYPWTKKISYFSDFMSFTGKDNVSKIPNGKAILDSLKLPKTKFNAQIAGAALKLKQISGDKKKRGEFIDSILSKVTISLFFILPIFTLFFTLFYIGQKSGYTENLVLVFNIQTVFFIVLLLDLLIGTVFSTSWILIILNLWFIYYLYRSLRNFYGQSRWLTILKMFLFIMPAYLTLASVGFLTISTLSLLF